MNKPFAKRQQEAAVKARLQQLKQQGRSCSDSQTQKSQLPTAKACHPKLLEGCRWESSASPVRTRSTWRSALALNRDFFGKFFLAGSNQRRKLGIVCGISGSKSLRVQVRFSYDCRMNCKSPPWTQNNESGKTKNALEKAGDGGVRPLEETAARVAKLPTRIRCAML